MGQALGSGGAAFAAAPPLLVFKLLRGAHALGVGLDSGSTGGSHANAFWQGPLEIEFAVSGGNHGAFDDILQLAHVTRPAISFKAADIVRRERFDRPAHAFSEFFGKGSGQNADIAAPLAQRRQLDGKTFKR